jgi:hypothetical protein
MEVQVKEVRIQLVYNIPEEFRIQSAFLPLE